MLSPFSIIERLKAILISLLLYIIILLEARQCNLLPTKPGFDRYCLQACRLPDTFFPETAKHLRPEEDKPLFILQLNQNVILLYS